MPSIILSILLLNCTSQCNALGSPVASLPQESDVAHAARAPVLQIQVAEGPHRTGAERGGGAAATRGDGAAQRPGPFVFTYKNINTWIY